MKDNYNNLKIKQIDFIDHDMNSTFFHYTNKNNLSSIALNGLEPRVGPNSMHVEKSKKIFFAIGSKGILTIMDVWLRWLTSKSTTGNLIYKLGTFYMRTPICIKVVPSYVVKKNFK